MVNPVFPNDVEYPHRQFARLLFTVECSVFFALFLSASKFGYDALVDPKVILQKSNTNPCLPYIYLCPGDTRYYDFADDVQAGCGMDVLGDGRSLITFFKNGTTEFRTDGNCSIGLAVVRTLSRIVKPYRERTCVWFKLKESSPINHRMNLYLMFKSSAVTARERNYDPSDEDIPKAGFLFTYFSDYGEDSLAQNDNFVINSKAIFSGKKKGLGETFQDYALRIPLFRLSAIRVMKLTRIFENKLRSVKYAPDGPLASHTVGDLSLYLLNIHNMSNIDPRKKNAVVFDATISSDEERLVHQGRFEQILELLASYGGYISLFGIIMRTFFTRAKLNEDEIAPKYRMRKQWQLLLNFIPWGKPRDPMVDCPY